MKRKRVAKARIPSTQADRFVQGYIFNIMQNTMALGEKWPLGGKLPLGKKEKLRFKEKI